MINRYIAEIVDRWNRRSPEEREIIARGVMARIPNRTTFYDGLPGDWQKVYREFVQEMELY